MILSGLTARLPAGVGGTVRSLGMLFKLSPEDRKWLKEHDKELPAPIERHFLAIVPGRREQIRFDERDSPRVRGQRVVVLSFSELDWEGDEGEVLAFEEQCDWDFSEEFRRFRGGDWDWLDWIDSEIWEEVWEEAWLYFMEQRCRILSTRHRYFQSKGNKKEANAFRKGLERTRRLIRLLWHNGFETGECRLTKKQRIVLNLLREGLSQAEIARNLGVSRANVSLHIKRIKELTGGRATYYILGADPNPTGPGLIHLQTTGSPRRRKRRTASDDRKTKATGRAAMKT